MQNTPIARLPFPGPRPASCRLQYARQLPSLAVSSPASRRLQYARQLPSLAVSSPASRRLQYAYASNGKLGKGLGKKLVARGVSAYQRVYCNLSFSSVVFYKSTALYSTAGNKTGSKSPINQKKCIVANALLLYSK